MTYLSVFLPYALTLFVENSALHDDHIPRIGFDVTGLSVKLLHACTTFSYYYHYSTPVFCLIWIIYS